VLGGVLVIVQGVLLAIQGLMSEDDAGLSLTTSVSMLVAYGVGALVTVGFILEGVTVAVLSSLLLVLKRELHEFAWGSPIRRCARRPSSPSSFVIIPDSPC